MKKSSGALALILLLASCSSQQASTAPESTTTPEASVLSAPEESTAEGSAPMSFEDVESGSGHLRAGAYVFHYSSIGGAEAFPTLAFTFTLPSSGWDRVLIDGLAWNDNGTRLGLAVVDNLYVDPCDPDLGVHNPPVGSSVDDLAAALGNVPGIEIKETGFDSYFGFPGVYVVLGGLADLSQCADGEARLAHALGFPGFIAAPSEGDEHELWILQVEGTRVIIHAASDADASDAARAALKSVVDSIEIQA